MHETREKKKPTNTAKPWLWRKGQPSPNPHGRPPAPKCIPDILRRILGAEPPPDLIEKGKNDPTFMDYILRKVCRAAAEPEQWAVEFIAERTEGRVPNVTKFSMGNSLASMAEDALAERKEQLDSLLKEPE